MTPQELDRLIRQIETETQPNANTKERIAQVLKAVKQYAEAGKLYIKSTRIFNQRYGLCLLNSKVIKSDWTYGYYLLKIHRKTLEVTDLGRYDMYNNRDENARRMIADLDTITSDYYCVWGNTDNIISNWLSKGVRDQLVAKMQEFGSHIETADYWHGTGRHSFIGIRGQGKGSAYEKLFIGGSPDPCEISTVLINGGFIGGGIFLTDVRAKNPQQVKLPNGTATTPPLIMAQGTNTTTPVNGALEFDGTNLYFTANGRRRQIMLVG